HYWYNKEIHPQMTQMAADKNTPRESYDPAFFQKLFNAEDKHFWFQARNRVIAAMVRRIVSSFPAGYRVLEVGCGTGNVLRVLEAECTWGYVIGMDLFEEGRGFASIRVRCTIFTRTDI